MNSRIEPPHVRTAASATQLPRFAPAKNVTWRQQAVISEVAPISFQDSNGDGKGDLPGLISRLGYLEWLGVDALWLTPIYNSPRLDLGYDIADFCSIDPLFGSLDDFDRL